MISRYEATMNGVALSGVSQSILILDISHREPRLRTETYTVAQRSGSRLYRRTFEKAETTITMEIREYDTRQRQNVIDAVNAWARAGGQLRTSDRMGKHLTCVCETFAAAKSVKKWTDAVSVTFAAYENPFWEDDAISETYFHQADTGQGKLYVPGNVEQDVFVSAEIYVNEVFNDSLTFGLYVNGRGLTVSNVNGYSIPVGTRIYIYYDEHRIQHVDTGDVGIVGLDWMAHSNGMDLIADCGENDVSFDATATLSVWFRARGLWV